MKKYGLLIAKIGYCAVVAGLLTGAGLLGAQRLREQDLSGEATDSSLGTPGRTAQFQELKDVEPSTGHGKGMVYVTGAVNRPGLYEVSLGARTIEAIQAAGGATEKADLERVNLAQKLPDGAHLIVPEASGGRPRARLHLPKVADHRVSGADGKPAPTVGANGTAIEAVAGDVVASL